MPFIQISILEGRTDEQKERLIEEVSQTVADILESPIENVRVKVEEMQDNHWGIAGASVRKRNQQ